MAQKPVSQENIESMSENSTNKPKEEETKTAIQENQGSMLIEIIFFLSGF